MMPFAIRNLAADVHELEIEQRASTDPDAKTTIFVASDDTEDRYGSVVKQDWDLKNFRKNPVILDSHDPRRVVGRAIEAKVPRVGDDTGKLIIEVEWNLASPDPTISRVGDDHLRGFRRACSVGWRYGRVTARDKLPTDSPYFRQKESKTVEFFGYTYEIETAGVLYEKNELLELSSVAVPGNANALQRGYGQPPIDPLDLIWSVLGKRLRSDAEVRRIIRALVEAGPPAPPIPAAAAAPTPSVASLVLRRLQEQ